PRGATISVAIGWSGEGLVDKGTFTVDAVSHSGTPDQMTIRATSADMRAELPARKSRSWHKTTVGEIASKIAKEHGLKLRISDALNGVRVAHIDQTDESDINFLTRLGQRFDIIATIKAGTLRLIPRSEE